MWEKELHPLENEWGKPFTSDVEDAEEDRIM